MLRIIAATLICLLPAPALTEDKPDYRGWEYLVNKLRADGIDPGLIDSVYLDPRMPPVEEVYFKLVPQESASIYEGFRNKKLISAAAKFLRCHRAAFDAAERVYKVNRTVIGAIMLVETRLGQNTGNHLVIERLSRIGTIAKPENVLINFKKHNEEDPKVIYSTVEERARYLENRFYPEVKVLFELAKSRNFDLLGLKGSIAGAFGIPQFLPSTFLEFGVDGDGNGIVSLFNVNDAIFSTANYLMHSGWKDNASQSEKESVIWKYNHSKPYIDTVLYIARALKGMNYGNSKTGDTGC